MLDIFCLRCDVASWGEVDSEAVFLQQSHALASSCHRIDFFNIDSKSMCRVLAFQGVAHP